MQDSKKLTDKRVHALAPMVRETVGKGRFKVTPLNPPRYNKLYDEFKAEGKNLNSLLAWGHTRSIEDLLEGGLKPRYAIVNQFADARYIEAKLLAETRQAGLQIFQFPKAEANIAVASRIDPRPRGVPAVARPHLRRARHSSPQGRKPPR